MDEQEALHYQETMYDQAARELERLRGMESSAALANLKQMDPTVFEFMTALLFEERGYPASSTGKPGDEGVDVLLQDGEYVGVVQCKRYDGSVGQPTIRDLYGTMVHNGAEEAYLVTTGTVTRQARSWSAGKPIHLIDGNVLSAWVTLSEPAPARGFALMSMLGGFFRSGWVRWPVLLAALLLFGWGIFYAVSQLSTRFSDDPVVEQQVGFADDMGGDSADGDSADGNDTESNQDNESNSDAIVASDEAPVDEQVAATQVVATEVPATEVLATPVPNTPTPISTSTPIPTEIPIPTAIPIPTTSQPAPENPSDGSAFDPMAAPTAANAVPAPTVAPTVDQSCAIAVDGGLRAWYDRDQLGCATSEMQIIWAAWEPFERGIMLWRSDTDVAYAFVADPQQQWFAIRERWDGTSTAEREDPPPGLQAPVRGFGYAWGVNDALFAALGWATEGEKGICIGVQSFESGTILQSSKVQSCTDDKLFNHATAGDWRPFTTVSYTNGAWE